MLQHINHEDRSSKTYATETNAHSAIAKMVNDDSATTIRYLVVRTSDDRFQPIITDSGIYAVAFAHKGILVLG